MSTSEVLGRQCPVSYRYAPSVFRESPVLEAETVYVIGGLYGNREALRSVLELKHTEEDRGRRVTLLFNGDFHWFDVNPEDFREIGECVLEHAAIRGNVEAELPGGVDCGCNYPAYVTQETVDQSIAIMQRLWATASRFPELTHKQATLPMHLTLRVGGQRIGILHGDPESLAGWQFAVENLEPLDTALRRRLGCPDQTITRSARVQDFFLEAGVNAFACTHTCLPFAQEFDVGDRRRLIINNGAAGMPNFRGRREGLMTRISVHAPISATSLYGIRLQGVYYDAIPIRYDHSAWMARFLEQWPPGSAAHDSYYRRLTDGPNFEPQQAAREGVRLS